ncbi:MAG: family 20 glycosylhydrolase [Saprospiraceae bacterium]
MKIKNLKYFIGIFFSIYTISFLSGQSSAPDTLFQVKGFSIRAPKPDELKRFIQFIHEELAPRHITHLQLRVDYNFPFTSHPELRDSVTLSSGDIRSLVEACKADHIAIIPQINLLGHQSSGIRISNLLKIYPQFDETPNVKMPEVYKWPNADGLYCKSYCPLHPDVHAIVFDLMDEVCDAFEAQAFHAGMDEVFYLGNDKCPRCTGVDKAELFAGEVTKIRNHLKLKNRELWIWGDRFIDGKSTGMGIWEASFNYTARAVDLIPKDVVICDWRYERPDQTAVYFAMKGFRVITCPWNKPEVVSVQVEDMARWRSTATKNMKPRYYGMMQTVWSSTTSFLDMYYNISTPPNQKGNPPETFRTLFKRIKELETVSK